MMLNNVKKHSQHLLISIFYYIFAPKIIIKNYKNVKEKGNSDKESVLS